MGGGREIEKHRESEKLRERDWAIESEKHRVRLEKAVQVG
jgi:hypothetical protein